MSVTPCVRLLRPLLQSAQQVKLFGHLLEQGHSDVRPTHVSEQLLICTQMEATFKHTQKTTALKNLLRPG